ncbi:hypothetical protein DFH07DRAFT_940740 [Mycena maculata]|uniref:Uncharacterized protein n=1 Tax=Mycena maculata TaxID=230809 RepID=A0AAD7NE75_9AGAR|nr:hypothetical protein DFH07DRAFT_940740 [Mycena maculata]
MYKQNTTSNECSDQISTGDGLIGSYGIAARDPKRRDINFLSIGPLASPYLHHFFFDPRLGGSFGSPDAVLPSGETLDGKSMTSFVDFIQCTLIALEAIVQNHAIPVLLIVGFFGGDVSNLEWSWASSLFRSSRTLIHPATPISRFAIDRKHVFCPFLYLISTP